MDRVLEPELMNEDAQARAYAKADFAESHSAYPQLFLTEFKTPPPCATVLDLGCGPADVTLRFARAFPSYLFHAVDGAEAMLREARLALERQYDLAPRIQLIHGVLPDLVLPQEHYDVILSSNLLHHLLDPQILWRIVKHFGRKGTLVFVTDLYRPASVASAQELVQLHAAGEPEVLRRDFFNSLIAAFTPAEIQAQLQEAKLNFTVKTVSDRHLVVSGQI
jgi:ubiquinone/menaquinone biosynthesis C-methylase UbiE